MMHRPCTKDERDSARKPWAAGVHSPSRGRAGGRRRFPRCWPTTCRRRRPSSTRRWRWVLWGAFVMLLPAGPQPRVATGPRSRRRPGAAQTGAGPGGRGRPVVRQRGRAAVGSLCLSALGLLAAAAAAGAHGGRPRGSDADAVDTLCALFCWGWLVAGVLNLAIAAGAGVRARPGPTATGSPLSGIAGRAVGNLRQPNHLSSLLLWSAIAAVALLELRRLPRALGARPSRRWSSAWC
jgi:hypothetical protein